MVTGYAFGAKTTAGPTFGTGSITFGTPATQTVPQFGFGAAATPNLFGSQPAAAPGAFGTSAAAATTTASSLFGTPAQAPAFGAAAAPSFGTPAAPSFGTPTGSGLSFATPATTAGLSFGTPTPTGLSFGTPAATGGLSFGTPTSTAFGAPTSTGAAGLNFGTPASTGLGSFGTTSSAPGGFQLGTSLGATAPTFGTTTTAPTLGLNFGGVSTAAPALSFGTTTTSAPTGLNFGSSGPLTFGTATSTAPAFGATSTGLAFGGTSAAPAFGATSAAPPFGATSAAPTFGGISSTPAFGATTTGLGFGLGGISASAPASTGLGLTLTTTSAQQSVGLGGIPSTQSKIGTTTATQKEVPPKEQQLPNEFVQLVDHFKNVVHQEKVRSSDVARSAVKEYHKVENELDLLNHQLAQLESQLKSDKNEADKLKVTTAKGLQNIEMAQRTQDTPPGLQYENTAPLQFFLDLAEEFEKEMHLLKTKIDNTEKFVKKSGDGAVLTSQDLTQGMKRLHEIFVALAGRMQSVHNQVEIQKEMFLSIRKQAIKDNINPFENSNAGNETMNQIMTNIMKTSPPLLASGPTPFNNMPLGGTNLSAQQAQPPAYPAATTATNLGFGLGNTSTFGSAQANASLFKPTNFGAQPFQFNTSNSFQLQKPPTGNKRGKQ